MTIVLATKNQDKIREIREILSDLPVEFKTMANFPDMPDVIEDGETLEENAIKKAMEFHKFTGLPALADDTGLEVDVLNGAPGVYSSRFAGAEASYADNRKKLIEELKDISTEDRGAQFRCVVAFVDGSRKITTEGIVRGKILPEEQGNSGFGYDPVFWVPEFKKTFAEIDLEKKNAISHRGIAFRKMKAELKILLEK